jgi:hypothetical protein
MCQNICRFSSPSRRRFAGKLYERALLPFLVFVNIRQPSHLLSCNKLASSVFRYSRKLFMFILTGEFVTKPAPVARSDNGAEDYVSRVTRLGRIFAQFVDCLLWASFEN